MSKTFSLQSKRVITGPIALAPVVAAALLNAGTAEAATQRFGEDLRQVDASVLDGQLIAQASNGEGTPPTVTEELDPPDCVGPCRTRLRRSFLPPNPDKGVQSVSFYNLMLMERLPLLTYDVITLDPEPTPEPQPAPKPKPVRGLWKTTPVGSEKLYDFEQDGTFYKASDSLTSYYAKREGLRTWVSGFGGSTSAFKTNRFHRNFSTTYGGGVVGLDYAFSENFQLGGYANYGKINTSENSPVDPSWDPDGWGGGVNAVYWTDNFYVQGVLGRTNWSGEQRRNIPASGQFGYLTNAQIDATNRPDLVRALKTTRASASGQKNLNSTVASVRMGLPMQFGKVYFEPRLTGSLSHNQEEGFTEGNGAFPFNLRYADRTTNYWFTDLGFKLALPIRTKQRGGLITPNLLVSWLGNWSQGNDAQRYYVPFSTSRRARGTYFLRSGARSEHALVLEGGLDYTVKNINATSFMLYARGGALMWDEPSKPVDWRASGGLKLQF